MVRQQTNKFFLGIQSNEVWSKKEFRKNIL